MDISLPTLGQFKLNAQQISGGLAAATGVSSTTRTQESQDQADASSTSLTQGNGNPLGLESINWIGVSQAIGAAQNIISSTSQNAGNNLATAITNSASQVASSAASSAASELFQGSPMVGAVAGSLVGAVTSKVVSSVVGTEVTKALQKINLKPIQKVLGQALAAVNLTNDLFGFLMPQSPSYQDISLSGRLATPQAQDGDIQYKNGVPTIPTSTHQSVVWQTAGDGEKPYTAVKKSYAVGSRMTFVLEGRKTVMTLLVNPKQLQISRSNTISNSVSRSGFIVNPTGPGEFDLSITGVTAAFYEFGQLSPRESKTVGYSNLLLLYNFFVNNGYIFDDEDANSLQKTDDQGVSSQFSPSDDKGTPLRRINSMSYVTIEWQKWKWWGFFKNFKISDNAENPYSLNYDFTFRVCHESENFRIDNARGADTQKPLATGHVTDGYSSERMLAQRVMANTTGQVPSVYQSVTPKHPGAIMSDVMFSDDSPTSALNPTVSLTDSAKRLSLGGYSLTQVTNSDGSTRYFGQTSDGTAIDLNGRNNQRSLTVVASGSSPVSYVSVAENSTDSDGNPLVTGTVKVSPGDLPYSYSLPGTVAE